MPLKKLEKHLRGIFFKENSGNKKWRARGECLCVDFLNLYHNAIQLSQVEAARSPSQPRGVALLYFAGLAEWADIKELA